MSHRNKQDLLKQIEKLRKQMNDLAKEKPLTDPEIIKISQHLDLLLNDYEYLKNKGF